MLRRSAAAPLLFLTSLLVLAFAGLAWGSAGGQRPAAEVPARAVHFTQLARASARQVGYATPPLVLPQGAVPSGWTSTTLPGGMPSDPHADPKAIVSAWYRVPVPIAPSEQPIYVYIPRMQAMGHMAIYADGRLVYAPHTSAKWNGFNLPIWTEASSAGAAPHEILINVQATARRGFALSSVWVGDKDALTLRHATRQFLQIQAPQAGCVVFMIIGLITLVLWIRRREEPAYLFIFAVACLQTIHSIEYFIGSGPLPISDNLLQWFESNSQFWNDALTFVMVSYYVGGRMAWARRLSILAGVLFSLWTTVLVLLSVPLEGQLWTIWVVGLALVLVTTAMTWLSYARAPTRIGLLFSLFNSTIFPASLFDILMAKFHLSSEGVFSLPLVPVLQAGLFLYILIDRHLAALAEAEALRSDLTVRLQHRETELSATHEQLRESEHRQTLTNERQRLMRDMHDGVGSSLIGALAVIERGEVDANETAQMLRDCLDDLKLAIDSLEPNDGDLLLLLATARYRLEPRLEQAGIRLVWSVGDLPPLPPMTPEHALHVLRIVQEIFTNIVKHAHAREVRLSVTARDEAVFIEIADDGAGFDVAQATARAGTGPRRRGLANLVARATAIGGAIDWTSTPGRTSVKIRIGGERPLPTLSDS